MPVDVREEFGDLPGAEIVELGLGDLIAGKTTEEALVTLSAGPRLRRLGIVVPPRPDIKRPCEHRLYELLRETRGTGAYSRYNSLIRRIVSFSRALEQRKIKEAMDCLTK